MTAQPTSLTSTIFKAVTEARPKLVFQDDLYPESYAISFVQDEGFFFMPGMDIFRAKESEVGYLAVIKLIENWASRFKMSKSVLFCDIADACLLDNNIPLNPEARAAYLAESSDL